MKNCSLASVTMAAACVFSCPALHAESKVWFSLPGGTTYNLVPDENGATTIRIPLGRASAAVQPPALTPRVIDAAFRDGRPESLANAISVAFVAANDKKGDALVVTVSNAAALRAGAYSVTLRAASQTTADDYQDIVLSLQRSALTLQIPPKIVLKLVDPFFWTERREPVLLTLTESSGTAKFESLKFADAGNTSATGLTGTGTLVFTPHAAKSPASAASAAGIVVDVTASGPYEFGKSTGRFQIQGPALGPDQNVIYEVNATRTIAWLVIIAIVGAYSGWLVRVKATEWQKLAKSRLAASLALNSLSNARGKIPDHLFVTTVDGLIAALRANDVGKNPDTINSAAKAATDGLATAVADLERRRGLLGARLNSYHSVLSKEWRLADPAMRSLTDLRAEVESAASLAAANDVAGAAVVVDTFESDGTLVNMVQTLNETNTALAVSVDRFFVETPPLPEVALSQLQSRCDDLVKETLPQSRPVSADADALNASLTKAHEIFFKAQQIVENVTPAAAAFIAWALSVLPAIDSAAARVLQQATLARIQATRVALSNPQANASVPDTVIAQWQADWIDFLMAFGGPVNQQVRELIQHSQWADAVNAVVAQQAAAGQQGATLQIGPAPPRAVGELGAMIRPASAAAHRPLLVLAPTVIDGSQTQQDFFQWESDASAALQTAFFAIIFIGSILALYGDAWVGTFKEMFAIYILAFGTDLTSDSVLTLARRVKLPGA